MANENENPALTMSTERLMELLAMSRECGTRASQLAAAEHAHEYRSTATSRSRSYANLQQARKASERAEANLASALARTTGGKS